MNDEDSKELFAHLRSLVAGKPEGASVSVSPVVFEEYRAAIPVCSRFENPAAPRPNLMFMRHCLVKGHHWEYPELSAGGE